MEEVKVSFDYRWIDYFSARKLYNRPKDSSRVLYSISMIVFYISLISFYLKISQQNIEVRWFGYLIFVALLVFFFLSQRSIGIEKAEWQEDKGWNGQFTVTLTSDGIAWENIFGKLSFSWDDIPYWREYEDVLLLFFSGIDYRVIPLKAFENEEIRYLKEQLNKNGSYQLPGRNNLINSLFLFCFSLALWLIRVFV